MFKTAASAIPPLRPVDAPISILALREVFVQGLLGIVLAVPVFPLIRRIVRPALVDDTAKARTRTPQGMRSSRRGPFGMMRGQGSL